MIPRRARITPRLPLLAAAALGAACAGTQWWHQDLQEWQGAPVSELMDAWGPPLRTLAEEDGTPVLVYERSRDLDHRLEDLRDPGARLRTDREAAFYTPPAHTECVVYFEVEAERVKTARLEGAACDIVTRDPARRRTDPRPRRER
jgi:hypothetical protein